MVVPAVILVPGLAAAASKGVQVYGYTQNSKMKIEFKWEDDKKRTQTIEPGRMYGKSCSHELHNWNSKFKIKATASVSRGLSAEPVAKVNGDLGVATMTGFNPGSSPHRVIGNIWPSDGSSHTQKSIITDNATFAYGMYAAGTNDGSPIKGRHQSYAYLTGNLTHWMGDLRRSNPRRWDANVVGTLTLAGAHDAGMWKLASPIDTDAKFWAFLSLMALEGGPITSITEPLIALGQKEVFNFMQNTSLTQKDSIQTALRSGVRYFDYRPARFTEPLSGISMPGYYHIHNFVPGYNFQSFLRDVVRFLRAGGNGHEIVIVNVKDDGILPGIFTPIYRKSSDLASATKTVRKLLKAAGGNPDEAIYTNSYVDIRNRTFKSLYENKTRLIFYFGTGNHDSYTKAAYSTFNPRNVINAMTAQLPNCVNALDQFTVFQMQDTASWEIFKVPPAPGELLAALHSVNGSILLGTKGMFDNRTYPWAMTNLKQCRSLTVMLNDFAGNLLALNSKRLTAFRTSMAPEVKTIGLESCP